MSARPRGEISQRSTKNVSARIYENLPLPRSKQLIRLLRLIPNGTESDTRLRGNLEVVALADNPEYAALSYVWNHGDRKDDFAVTAKESVIHCNNSELRITRNCYDALSSLRNLYGSISIWVDAICIDQENEMEKASQIGIMTDIYTLAKTVFVWLGLGSSATERAIDSLKQASEFRVYTPGIPWASDQRMSLNKDKFWLICSILYFQIGTIFPYPHWLKIYQFWKMFSPQDINKLLDNKWAHRAWTYQEIVFSSNPVIVCGARTLTWAKLQNGIDYLENPVTPYEILAIKWLIIAFSYASLTSIDNILQPSKSPFVTNQLIRSFRTWKNMHRVWKKACRKTLWNDERLGTLLATNNEAQNRTWSVAGYQGNFIGSRHTLFAYELTICIQTVLWGTIFALSRLYLDTKIDLMAAWFGFMSIPGLESVPFLPIHGTAFCVFYFLFKTALDREDNAEKDISTEILTELTRALREREATEAADKAFALHEVFNNLDIQISSSRADYQRPTGKVYQTLYLDLLRHRTSFINLLIDSSGPETFLEVPSWVPDWSQTHKNDWNQSDFIYDYIELYGTEASEPQMQISTNKLGLWALRKDAVQESFPTMSISPSPPESSDLGKSVVGLAMSFVRQVSRAFGDASTSIPCSTPGRMNLVHLKTLRALTGLQSTPEDDRHSDIETLTRCIDFSRGPPLTSTALLSAFHDDDLIWPFMARCYRYVTSRVIFVTAEGLYGTGPPGMAVSDQVMWLRGVAIPMILRPVEDGSSEFKVIGPAVIPGLMDLSVFNGTDYGDKWEAVYLI